MLTRLDRMLLAVRDREAAADTFCDILGAERVREDTSPLLAARRTVVPAAVSEFERLEPAGDGPVAAQLERWGEGIFAAGFATADVPALAARLSERGIEHSEENGRLFIAGPPTRSTPPEQLGRIELTQITGPSLAMGRYYARPGQSVYMCYVETDDVQAVQRRLEALDAHYAARSDAPNPE